jgi:hypothetical protein
MNKQQSSFFETWVRQEQIGYWLIALAWITMSVVALAVNASLPPPALAEIEGTTGTIVVEESPALVGYGLFLLSIPALWGLLILYWTSNRDHVRALTSSILHHNVMRWRFLGIVFVALGLLQFFTEGSILQRVIIAPSLLIFGIFALFRSIKLATFRALGEIK